MSGIRCLFGAPWHFLDRDLRDAFQKVLPTEFCEIWRREDLPSNGSRFTAWITHPGYQFVVDESVLTNFPNLKVLVTASTGVTHLDIDALNRKNIAVYSLLDMRAELDEISASAEYTFLLLLNGFKGQGLCFANSEVRAGRWRQAEDQMRGFELQGKKIGLIGYGRIGKRMERFCTAFGAEIVFFDPYQTGHGRVDTVEGVLSTCDGVVVCCSLTDETRGFLDYKKLSLMRKNVVFVNTARGEILVEQHLAILINERPEMRVGLDVLSGENDGTIEESHLLPLARLGRITVVPHIAGATYDSQRKAATIAFKLVSRFLEPRA